MDPVTDNEWLTCKNDPIDEVQTVGNVARSWQWRERGIDPPHYPPNKTVLENIAEDILVQKSLKIRCCELPGYPRSTFLMVFSPDGTKVASTHGNHNVYVSELASGKHVRILKGHPRTPWCIAFHPSHPQLIGSGCLGGQVRVWDISSGGSEVWNVHKETVIASIAFHPREQLLVIATYNELYFWDWSQPAPFTRVSTNNINEKVRYVAFDALGYKLITGISLCANFAASSSILQQNPMMGQTNNPSGNRRDDPDDNQAGNRPQDNSGSAQDMIVNSYQNLVQRYDSLVRNYQRLFMVRHRLTNTPPPPSTIDRGTDPMETDVSAGLSGTSSAGVAGPSGAPGWPRLIRASTATDTQDDAATPGPSTSHQQDAAVGGDEDGSSNRLLNLDVLSFDLNFPRNQDSSNQDHSHFGSRSSAFQPLTEGRAFQTVDQNERSTRLLPNPFSSTATSRTPRAPFPASTQPTNGATNTSRTSIFTSSRPESSMTRDFLQRRRNSSPSHNSPNSTRNLNMSLFSELNRLSPRLLRSDTSSTSATNTAQRPTMTNSSTQMSPSPVSGSSAEAQTINESLDLIRDILRDSGNRLLNLITNMSLSTLANVERSMPRRGGSRAQSEDSESVLPGSRPRMRPLSSTIRRELLSSSSDSDSDQSLEVNIFRTRNSTFREDVIRDSDSPGLSIAPDRQLHPTDRMEFELNDESRNDEPLRDPGRFNVSLSSSRFRVRTQSNSAAEVAGLSNRDTETDPSIRNSDAGPSTRNSDAGPSTRNSDAGPSTRNSDVGPSTRNSDAGPSIRNSDPGPSNRDAESDLSNRDAEAGPSNVGAGETTENGSQGASDFNPNIPSTSSDDAWRRSLALTPEEAYRRVRIGVSALQKHTTQLTNLWLHGNRVTMRELRTMWDTLRRRVQTLHRESGRQDMPNTYTKSLLERCMMLTERVEARTSSRYSRFAPRNEGNERGTENNQGMSADDPITNSSDLTESELNARTNGVSDTRPCPPGRTSQARSSSNTRSSPSLRRRLQSSFRWRPEDELRRRSRNPTSNRLAPRFTRPRRDATRAFEISATRHEIRMRAMQVLSVMFSMMMKCLEERGLSQVIINMLRTLKKALALTCLMLMMNRNSDGRTGNAPAAPAPRVESLNVVRIQNVDHSGPVNVDGPDEPTPANNSASTSNEAEQSNPAGENNESKLTQTNNPSTTESNASKNNTKNQSSPSTSNVAQRWSNRLAVQIAEANRNNSSTARNRRDLYMESRRMKALHRTNPTVHPFIKRRIFPPVSTHRIPALRYVPSRVNSPRFATPKRTPRNDDPVPSTSAAAPVDPLGEETPRDEMLTEFEHRVNLIRLAHLQAVRLRNAARTRFRRLQTIRLYTPSSVREMFEFNSNNGDNPPERSPLQNGGELGNRRSFTTYRPHIIATRGEAGDRAAEEPGHFHTVLNNVAMPLMQINDLPASSEAQGSQQQRLPRIHEYLQPIILAQNAMVVDEEGVGGEGAGGGGVSGGGGGGGGGVGASPRRYHAGMAGLLDAGFVPDTLPAPSHRVQAWDFTTGNTPDIADSTKNVVVQRCRIHNDASIDISKDGRLLVALLPVPRLRNTNHWLGVYSLEWSRLGQCLHTAVLEQNAVSVALSPTARHLAVGLGSRRFTSTTTPPARNSVFALLYRLEPLESSSRSGLSPIKELEQNWEHGFTSLNCLRWAPQPGQGLVYANNTGQLIVMS